jgi:hypothetical protein
MGEKAKGSSSESLDQREALAELRSARRCIDRLVASNGERRAILGRDGAATICQTDGRGDISCLVFVSVNEF